MSVISSIEDSGKNLTIKVDGRFDFSSHHDFREAYENHEGIRSYVIDLEGATYLDSSALGMLLLLRDYAGGDNSEILLINCNNDVKKILTISNFEQLFTVQ